MSDEAVAAHQADLRAQIANLTEHAEAAQAELDARTARKKISALSPAEREALLEGEAEFQALKLQLEADKKARS
jgi:hypothetical protein